MAELHAVQLVSGPDVGENLQQVRQLLREKIWRDNDNLVVLPECFACFGAGDKRQSEISEHKGLGPIQKALSEFALEFKIWLIAGTVPLKTREGEKFSASSLVFNPQGECVAEYQKMHLFDVTVADSTRNYQESRFTSPGNQVVVVEQTPFGRIGLSVCYDLRFAGLYQAMGLVDVIVAPSAFTAVTGAAHWQTLIQARAIEKQAFLVAANQGGVHQNGRETFGHSQVISPWGESLAMQAQGVGIISTPFDANRLTQIRAAMPVSEHNKFRSSLIENR